MNKDRLAQIEEYVLGSFVARRRARLLTREVFGGDPRYANADIVRAFEALEKQHRLLVRFTEEGDDWVQLTPAGAAQLGLNEPSGGPTPQPHPPKSST
ncbi:MAG TPA: hypothetical protein VK422_17355 [Pyrinomonadaceae bacterium]|nr:hypothetical protein [Pyrinomonadaceae bacterium]